jgi:hypothetical protein
MDRTGGGKGQKEGSKRRRNWRRTGWVRRRESIAEGRGRAGGGSQAGGKGLAEQVGKLRGRGTGEGEVSQKVGVGQEERARWEEKISQKEGSGEEKEAS